MRYTNRRILYFTTLLVGATFREVFVLGLCIRGANVGLFSWLCYLIRGGEMETPLVGRRIDAGGPRRRAICCRNYWAWTPSITRAVRDKSGCRTDGDHGGRRTGPRWSRMRTHRRPESGWWWLRWWSWHAESRERGRSGLGAYTRLHTGRQSLAAGQMTRLWN